MFQQWGSKGKLAPVLFNIHGAGSVNGEKRALYPLNEPLEAGKNRIIYIRLLIGYVFPYIWWESEIRGRKPGAFDFTSNLEPSSSNVSTPKTGLPD
jgi:hypothetical protein